MQTANEAPVTYAAGDILCHKSTGAFATVTKVMESGIILRHRHSGHAKWNKIHTIRVNWRKCDQAEVEANTL